MTFSRKEILAPKVLDVNSLLRDMSKSVAVVLGESITLRLDLEESLGSVRADIGQLEQAMMNLVLNARDAMPAGGALVMKTENAELDESYAAAHPEVEPGPFVLLAISDTGIGMDKTTRERIFEPFFTTKPPGMGTGLGLSTVYGFVRQSGGVIYVYSEPGQGTTFKIYFPRQTATVEVRGLAPLEVGRPCGAETILLAEDEEAVRRLITMTLCACGYTVLAAARPEQALEIAATHAGPIHLLLTDVVMPGFPGPELARRLKETRPETRVLFMSGYLGAAVERYRDIVPGENLVSKPFSPDLLARAVRHRLDGGPVLPSARPGE